MDYNKRIDKSKYSEIKIPKLSNKEFEDGESGIIYDPYIIRNHTEESLKEYNNFIEKYNNEHKCCPKCKKTGGVTTLVAYVLIKGKEDEYRDLNSYTCSHCNHVCKVHDRIPIPNNKSSE